MFCQNSIFFISTEKYEGKDFFRIWLMVNMMVMSIQYSSFPGIPVATAVIMTPNPRSPSDSELHNIQYMARAVRPWETRSSSLLPAAERGPGFALH